MKTKIMKPLIRGGFILLCLSILGSLLSSSSVLAQEPNKKSGELEGGDSVSIPFEIKVGEMVQGELECEEALEVTIFIPALEKSVDFGRIIDESFFYAAETEGTYHIKITNPTKETIVYTLSYTVLPANVAPGMYSGPGVTGGELASNSSYPTPFQITVGEILQAELASEKALEVSIFIPALEKTVDFGEIVGSFFYAAATEGSHHIRITNTTGRTTGYTLTYTVLPTNLAPGTYSGPGVKGGELESNFSDSIPFEIKVGEMVQGELECEEALEVTIFIPALEKSVDFGKIIDESFFYAAETEGTYHIKITNPTKETIVYTLSYTVLPTSLAPGTKSGPGMTSGELESNFSDHIPFQIKVGEMVQGELTCKEALRVIIRDPFLRESVDFGKIVGSFFYAAETEGRNYIKITNPTKETIVYTLSYTVLPTSLAPGTHSGPGIIRRNWPAIIFGVLAVGGIIYLFIRRKKKRREFEQRQAAFVKRIKRTE